MWAALPARPLTPPYDDRASGTDARSARAHGTAAQTS